MLHIGPDFGLLSDLKDMSKLD